MQRLLTHMAAAEPHRYVVVDADGPADEVAERIVDGLPPLLPPAPGAVATVPTPLPRPSADPATVGIAARGHASTGYGPTSSAPAHPPERLPRSGADSGPLPSGADPRHALVRRYRPDRRSPTSAARSRTARPAATEPPKAAP